MTPLAPSDPPDGDDARPPRGRTVERLGASSASAGGTGTPRAVLLLPVALFVHVVEEWFGGFPEWTIHIMGDPIAPERFLLINGIGLVLFSGCALTAVRDREAAWLGVVMAGLLGLNALLHVGGSLIYGGYAPGVVTGVVLYVPLSGLVLWQSRGQMPERVFAGSVLGGVGLHALVTLLALG